MLPLTEITVTLVKDRVQNFLLVRIGNQTWLTSDREEARVAVKALMMAELEIMRLQEKLPA